MSVIRKKYDQGDTQLNKLKFEPTMGSGHPGKPPLIKKRIPTGENPSEPFSGNQISARIDDTSRIGQLFARKEGLMYLANNTLLNKSIDSSYKVKSTVNRDKSYSLSSTVGAGSSLLDTLETLGSTLAQVPVAGTGTHFVKGKLFSRPNNQLEKRTLATKNLGDPGAVIVRYNTDTLNPRQQGIGQDLVNMTPVLEKEEDIQEDYIKFVFEVLSADEDPIPQFLQFRAFLDSFDDNFTGNWNKFNYIGRAESFHTYQSFDRNVSVSFKVAAASKQEILPIYTKLNYLASTTAPSYSEIGIMRGTIIRMTVGNYLTGVPGYLSSVNLSWSNNYPWEIDGRQLPHILNCSVGFTPIHEFTPQVGKNSYINNYRPDVTGESDSSSAPQG